MMSDPGLADIVKRRVIPQSPAEFWAMVSVLVAVLAIAIGGQQGSTTTNSTVNQTVNEKTIYLPKAADKPTGSASKKSTSHPKRSKSKGKARRNRSGELQGR